MKRLLRIVPQAAVLLALASFTGEAMGRAASTSEDKSRKVLTEADFKKLLCSTSWSWERPNSKDSVVYFSPDGTMTNGDWIARYTINNRTEVTLRLQNRKGYKSVTLKFAEDHDSYTGRDFTGIPLSGKPLKK